MSVIVSGTKCKKFYLHPCAKFLLGVLENLKGVEGWGWPKLFYKKFRRNTRRDGGRIPPKLGTHLRSTLHWHSLSATRWASVDIRANNVAWSASARCAAWIHQLLVHQSGANHACGSVRGLSQFMNLHHALRCGNLDARWLASAQVCSWLCTWVYVILQKISMKYQKGQELDTFCAWPMAYSEADFRRWGWF